jgi:hypothetical protein
MVDNRIEDTGGPQVILPRGSCFSLILAKIFGHNQSRCFWVFDESLPRPFEGYGSTPGVTEDPSGCSKLPS